MTSTTTTDQKRAANMLIQRNYGFKFPASLLRKLKLDQIRRIMAILNESNSHPDIPPMFDAETKGYSFKYLLDQASYRPLEPIKLSRQWDTEAILAGFISHGYELAVLRDTGATDIIRLFPGMVTPT